MRLGRAVCPPRSLDAMEDIVMLQQQEITPVERQPTPASQPTPAPKERPLDRALAEIALDAHEAPARYLRETVVPKGGE